MTCPQSHQDGAYLLGALAPQERRAYEEHLADCPMCATALSEVAGLPGLLAQLPAEAVEAADPPPADLLPALLRAVQAERFRSRRRVRISSALAAAAALVIIALLGTAVVRSGEPGVGPAATAAKQMPMSRLVDIPIKATAALVDRPWGTEVDLRCTYTGEVDGRRDWLLVAVARDGTSEQIAVWSALPYDEAKVIGSTSLSSADLAAVEVRTTTGTTLLRLQR